LKLTKAQLREQLPLIEILKKEVLTYEEKEKIYESFNPGMIGDVSQSASFFTPYDLAQDLAVMVQVRGNVIDLAAGIGMLAYRVKEMDTYEHRIKSITCIEQNPEYINPPFGQGGKVDWLNYTGGHRDLQAVEVCLRYSKAGYFILPSGSVSFKYSGEQYYKDEPDRYSQKLKKFITDNKHINFDMICDGIDCGVHKEKWVNLNGISVEAVNVAMYPYYSDCKEDSLIHKLTSFKSKA